VQSTTRYLAAIPVTKDAVGAFLRQSTWDATVVQLVVSMIEFTAVVIASAELNHEE
jgi:hypothetical protein